MAQDGRNGNSTRIYNVDDLIKFARTGSFGHFNEAIYSALQHLKTLQIENAELKQELAALDEGFEEIDLGSEPAE